MNTFIYRNLFFLFLGISLNSFGQVKRNSTTEQTVLSNGKVSFTFQHKNADVSAVSYAKHDNVLGKNGRFYLLGPGFSMAPSEFRVVRENSDLVEIAFKHIASNHFTYDLHYILTKETSGIYCYLVQSHAKGDSIADYGQTRFGIRADEQLFDYHLVRDDIQGKMPPMSALTQEIQDWTYRLPDSSVYTKYDFSDYIDGRYVHGMAGEKSGLGMFIIQASHEYLNGGPTKQYNTVHSTPFLMNMFNCGHYLLDKRKGDNLIKDDWTKLNGPFLIYFNEGKNIKTIWADAKRKAEAEKVKWPYSWMSDKEYPFERGAIKGNVQINGKVQASARIILANPNFDWQAQSQGYIFDTRSQKDGSFLINNVRAGKYTLYVVAENVMEEFRLDNVQIEENKTLDLGKVSFQPSNSATTLWQIGTADRTTKGFGFSERNRNYQTFTQTPENLDFYIGKSKIKDWYYAQTKNGSWNIHFDLPDSLSNTKGEYVLTVGVAGASRNASPEVLINGNLIGKRAFGNDASIYRSAILSGYYQQWEIHFSAEYLKQKGNTLSFVMKDLKHGAGIMYDAIQLGIAPKQKLVFQDDFSRKELVENWVTEWDKAKGSSYGIKDEKLWVDTQGGISVWLNQKLPQNVRIECTRNVVEEGKPNDRLSDLNFFWSCQDPKFERKSDGNFATYDSLALYYVGIGGNYNSTTRLRKYDGRGERVLWQEKNDKAHLLTENTVYKIVLEVKQGQVSVWVNGELYFTQKDLNPLGGGYFAIRSTKSRQWIDDIKIYELLE